MLKRNLTLLLVTTLVTGCATLDVSKSLHSIGKKPSSKDKTVVPTRVVAIWSDAVYTEPGKPAVRGFGGRFYFYSQDNQSVPVEGQLVVYGFDDSVEAAPAKEPERKFVITGELLKSHFTPGELGPSYSIWIPWEPVGGFKKTVSLLPVLTCAGGQVVTGQQTVNVLPGKSLPQPEALAHGREIEIPAGENQSVQRVAYEQAQRSPTGAPSAGDLAVPVCDPTRRLRTTTIALPLETTQRLLQSGSLPPAVGGNGSSDGNRMPPDARSLQTDAPERTPLADQSPNGMPMAPRDVLPTADYPTGRQTAEVAQAMATASNPTPSLSRPTRFERLRSPALTAPAAQ